MPPSDISIPEILDTSWSRRDIQSHAFSVQWTEDDASQRRNETPLCRPLSQWPSPDSPHSTSPATLHSQKMAGHHCWALNGCTEIENEFWSSRFMQGTFWRIQVEHLVLMMLKSIPDTLLPTCDCPTPPLVHTNLQGLRGDCGWAYLGRYVCLEGEGTPPHGLSNWQTAKT